MNTRVTATPQPQPKKHQGTRHAPTATRTPGDPPRPHDNHTNPRGPATLTWRPHEDQGTRHATTAATLTPGDQPRHHSGYTNPWGPHSFSRRPHEQQWTSHAPRRHHENQGKHLQAITMGLWYRAHPLALWGPVNFSILDTPPHITLAFLKLHGCMHDPKPPVIWDSFSVVECRAVM